MPGHGPLKGEHFRNHELKSTQHVASAGSRKLCRGKRGSCRTAETVQESSEAGTYKFAVSIF